MKRFSWIEFGIGGLLALLWFLGVFLWVWLSRSH